MLKNNEKYNSVIKIGLLGYNISSITFELICAKVHFDSNGTQNLNNFLSQIGIKS